MDVPWGDERTKVLVTNVGLITSDGPYGPNVMAAEWTHHASYQPGLFAVHVGPGKATHANISKTKEFGVNIASAEQSVFATVAGNNTGRETDKMKVLESLGAKFYKAKTIRAPMIEGASLNAECALVKTIEVGDHTMFVGEVKSLTSSGKEPLVYHGGKYWHVGPQTEKPGQPVLQKIAKLVEQYHKK